MIADTHRVAVDLWYLRALEMSDEPDDVDLADYCESCGRYDEGCDTSPRSGLLLCVECYEEEIRETLREGFTVDENEEGSL